MRMARVNITVPDDIVNEARAAGLNVSRIATAALADELERLRKIAALDAYLAELETRLGPISADEHADAVKWADRVLGEQSSQSSPGTKSKRRRSA